MATLSSIPYPKQHLSKEPETDAQKILVEEIGETIRTADSSSWHVRGSMNPGSFADFTTTMANGKHLSIMFNPEHGRIYLTEVGEERTFPCDGAFIGEIAKGFFEQIHQLQTERKNRLQIEVDALLDRPTKLLAELQGVDLGGSFGHAVSGATGHVTAEFPHRKIEFRYCSPDGSEEKKEYSVTVSAIPEGLEVGGKRIIPKELFDQALDLYNRQNGFGKYRRRSR